MPWINLDRLLSILRRNRIDPREIEVYIEEEIINPHPRNPERERLEPDANAGDEQDDEESEY